VVQRNASLDAIGKAVNEVTAALGFAM
jgi:hypothetical protein